ncbi:MAG TPA: amidohydrolase family protein [Prosthecobacter sp.]|nr:amidohydrolase family protein [Prosthecobacter sp.]
MNRRHWLQTTAAAAVAAYAPKAPAAPATRIVDTHTHFYDPTRPEGVPWPAKGTKLYRKVMPADWLALSSPHGVTETVVVEASQWVEDNQWILDLAQREKCIVGFVGNLDPNDPQFGANLKRFAADPIFRGLRWRGDLVRIDVNKDKVLAGAKLLAERALSLDLNGGPDMLPHAAQLAGNVPDLRIVINHLGAPGDPRALKPGWKESIQTVAARKNVFMKVSALVEQVKGEEGKAPDDAEYYRPILDHLWETFGPDRLVYGSNWPVSDRGAPYAAVFKIVRDYFATKGTTASENYFWKNSLTAYCWTGRN